MALSDEVLEPVPNGQIPGDDYDKSANARAGFDWLATAAPFAPVCTAVP